MDAELVAIFATCTSIASTLALVFGVAWFRTARGNRELERQLAGAGPDGTLERLQGDLIALSEQVEQLANGQEFLSRLVSNRLKPSQPQPPEPRAATPQ